MFYELAVSTWGAEELDAIQRVIASDRFTMGPNVAAFEQAFAAYHNRQIRGDGEFRLVGQPDRGGGAVLQEGSPACSAATR